MNLNVYASELKRQLFDDLIGGAVPRRGTYNETLRREAKTKGKPQMGAVRYTPGEIIIEFIFPDPSSSTIVLPITVESPERIVFLPVPEWVIESIWQGDIDGSYHFESHARTLVSQLAAELEPAENAKWFGPRAAKRRE